MRDIYQIVTDRIIASIEAGTAPWMKPWTTRVIGIGSAAQSTLELPGTPTFFGTLSQAAGS